MYDGDRPFDQRQMRGWSSRPLTGTVRFDSVTPLSYVQRKTGSFASPSRDGFAFVVEATVLRYLYEVKVSSLADKDAKDTRIKRDLGHISRRIRCEGTTRTSSRRGRCESAF